MNYRNGETLTDRYGRVIYCSTSSVKTCDVASGVFTRVIPIKNGAINSTIFRYGQAVSISSAFFVVMKDCVTDSSGNGVLVVSSTSSFTANTPIYRHGNACSVNSGDPDSLNCSYDPKSPYKFAPRPQGGAITKPLTGFKGKYDPTTHPNYSTSQTDNPNRPYSPDITNLYWSIFEIGSGRCARATNCQPNIGCVNSDGTFFGLPDIINCTYSTCTDITYVLCVGYIDPSDKTRVIFNVPCNTPTNFYVSVLGLSC